MPTRATSKIATLIDHVLTNSSQKISQCSVVESGISNHNPVYYTKKTPSRKLNKHNDIFIRSMKNYTKENFLEPLGKTDFPDYTTFTCLNKACQNFIFKLSEVIDLLCASKKLRLKANSKPWINSKTISAICRRLKIFKKYKKFGLETDKDHFRLSKRAPQKAIYKKKKSFFFFQEKIEC